MPAVLSRRRFDVDEYHAMGRAGILDEDDRVELLDGEIVEMHPIGSRHASCVNRLNQILVTALAGKAVVAIQNPVRLSRFSEPEPDVSVLDAREDFYAVTHPEPGDTLLIIEVADISLAIDRRIKLPLYAAAGIREVWIVDLETNGIEVHREPEGDGYGLCTRVTDGALTPLALPELRLEVAAILPPV